MRGSVGPTAWPSSREPDPTELRLAAEFLGEGRELDHLCLALLNINEFVYID